MNNKKFKIYEEIRQNGLKYMCGARQVIALSDGKLTRKDVLDIMENYGKYKEMSEKIDERTTTIKPFQEE